MCFLCMFLSSCILQSTKVKEDIFTESSEINFVREEYAKDFRLTQFIETDSINLFVNLFEDENKLSFYNYNSGQFLYDIKIPTKYRIGNYFVNNLNSIYFIPHYYFKVFEYKPLENTVISVFELIDADPENMYIGYRMSARTLKMFEDYDMGLVQEIDANDFYVNDTVFYIKNSIDPREDLNIQRSLYILSTKKNQFYINSKVGIFPKKMDAKDKTLYPFTREIFYAVNNKNQTVISYMADNSLYIYEDTTLIKTIDCKSSIIDKLPEFIEVTEYVDMYKNMNMKEPYFVKKVDRSKLIKERLSTNNYYQNLYYDTYRNVYYRIVSINKNEDKKFSIMLIDSDFKVIGEQIFSAKDYISYSLKITNEGIMIQRKDDLSGTTRYTLFKINEKYLKK